MFSKKHIYRGRSWLFALFLCSLTLFFCLSQVSLVTQKIGIGQVVRAQSFDTDQIVQQGLERYQAGDAKGAIKLWQQALIIYQKNNNSAASVIVRENLARAYQQVGQLEEAMQNWDKIVVYYRQGGNWQQVARSLTEQAQVYSRLGKPQEAIKLLCNSKKDDNCSNGTAISIARTAKDSIGEAAALGALGDANRLVGEYDAGIKNLQKSLAIANKLNQPLLRVAILNSLGNTHISLARVKYRQATSAEQRGDAKKAPIIRKEAQQQDATALKYLQESLEIARTQKDILGEVRSLLRIIPLYPNNVTSEVAKSIEQVTNLLEKLPESRARVYATIDLVHLLQTVAYRTTCLPENTLSKAEALLDNAVKIANKLEDFRALSFALGELGRIYECRKEYAKALEITSKARWAGEQNLKAQDSLYLWEWQTGRILKAQGKTKEAIAAYDKAIATLETIRRDILTANRDIQFDFRDNIEPIYRDLVAMRLSLELPVQAMNKSVASKDSQTNFQRILETIDLLKLAELQNFFGNDCIITAIQPENIRQIGDSLAKKNLKTAFINTIVLSDKTAVILTLPDGKNELSWIPIQRQDLIEQVNQFRRVLESYFNDSTYETASSQQFYNWLVSPFSEYLKKAGIKTLVFIQDGILRSIPMAALYDGKENKFLIQQYAIATTPGINLTDTKPLNRNNLRLLALGLSEAALTADNEAFKPLDNVADEIAEITKKIPGKKLLNDEFTISRLKTELSQQAYSIIHIATHGTFGSEPDDTFIVTGKFEGKNGKLTFNQLEEKIRTVSRNTQALELLALTACKTAVGDERSTLGMAGIAVQAGAKSALASLWAINDVSTAEIATNFYQQILSNRNISKAEALQAAQVSLIEGKEVKGRKFTHPGYWSPYILIGNWL